VDFLIEHEHSDWHQYNTENLEDAQDVIRILKKDPNQEVASNPTPDHSRTEHPGARSMENAGPNQDHCPQDQQSIYGIAAACKSLTPRQGTKNTYCH
jgi:hypothetical protein